MQIFITFILLPYIRFVRSEWVELPHIAPPRSSGSRVTTNPSNQESSKFIKDFSSGKQIRTDFQTRGKMQTHEESSYEEYFPISSSRSYEDSRSLGDYKSRPWNTRRSSSPFSSDNNSFDSSSYYRWRNISTAKVTGSPNIAESIDYTIVSPESTPLQDDEGLGFPKNIIISSKTPMISGPEILVKKGMKRKPITVDSKLDEESMGVTDGNRKGTYDEQEEENESGTDEKNYEESNEVPKPDFDKDDIVENEDEYDEDVEDEYEETSDKDHLTIDLNQTSESTKSAQISAPSWKNFSFTGFLRYLKQIQDRFLFKTSRTVEDKVLLLENLREKIANQIITRVDNLFSNKRSKRSFWSEKEEEHETEKHKDGIDFPSAEGALLSIAFLTFAVFLIKLVLQVIAAIKYKYAYYGSGPGGGALVANVIKQNRNARRLSMTDDDIRRTAQIMDTIM